MSVVETEPPPHPPQKNKTKKQEVQTHQEVFEEKIFIS